MIQSFKRLKLKNFLSIGRSGQEIPLETGFSVVTGTNGAGKSSIFLDGILFALYGKPYRDVNKPQLINSVNGKGCEVEITFLDKKHTEWTIQRGIKPNYFEIMREGEPIESVAGVTDLQDYLESNILGMNHAVFKQLVVVGTAGFTPFMELPAWKRRKIIEDLLDIGVFTAMSDINKREIKRLNTDIKELEHQESLKRKDADYKKQIAQRIKSQQESRTEDLEAQLSALEQSIEKHELESQELEQRLQDQRFLDLKDRHAKLSGASNKIQGIIGKMSANIEQTDELLDFFKRNDVCPTCEQSIDSNYKQGKIASLGHEQETSLKRRTAAEQKSDEIRELRSNHEKTSSEHASLKSDLNNTKTILGETKRQADALREKISEHGDNTGEIDQLRSEITGLVEKLRSLRTDRENLNAERHVRRGITEMLKDTGIKTAIVQEYVPFINSCINKFLDIMGADYAFFLDADFKETIKSRGRDKFSYGSFSAGERSRIEVAILMAFREIMRVKYGADVQLLILDELLDGSADAEAVDAFMSLFREHFPNVVLITHNSLVIEQADFDTLFSIEKQGNFSAVEITHK